MYLIRSNTQRLNQTVNRFPRSLVRSYLFLSLALLLLRVGAAELPKSATLDDVLALATRPERPAKESGNDDERCTALRRLQDWPLAAPEDEARIAAAFTSSLRATNSNICNAGAWGLGRRGHSEAIPTIFELAEKDCNLIGCFFQNYTLGREVEPPLDYLRRGLRSKNPDTRAATLDAIPSCKAVTLRPELEATLATDPSSRVRDYAASALYQLRLRESSPVFRRALASGPESEYVAYGLTQLGSDADIAAVLPLLKSKNESLRRTVAAGLSTANLTNSRPACDALLEAIRDPSHDVRIATIRALGHFREPRAIAPIREIIAHPPQPISWNDGHYYVDAVSAIGGADAIALLDDMVAGFRKHSGLEAALVRFATPSSARAVWAVYLKDPIRANPGSELPSAGYKDSLDVLTACADAELLREIQARLSASKDYYENRALEKLVPKIQARLNK